MKKTTTKPMQKKERKDLVEFFQEIIMQELRDPEGMGKLNANEIIGMSERTAENLVWYLERMKFVDNARRIINKLLKEMK